VFHGTDGKFDLNTGRTCCGHGNKKLILYPVTVKGARSYVDLE